MNGLFLRTDSSSSMFNGGGGGGAEVTPVKSSPENGTNPAQSPLSSPGMWSAHAAQAGSPGPSQIGSPIASQFASPAGSPAASAASSSGGGAAAPTSSSIVVAIRMRPLSERETSLGDSSIWRAARALSPDGATPGPAVIEELQDAVGKQYRFDYLCPAEESTTDLYKNLVRRFVLKSCVGYNANVFAYGQTAAGKTYTTLGDSFSPGIVLLAIGDIFHYIAQSPNRQFLLRISCLEIYNEEINDLLVSDGSGQNLKLENVGGLNKDGTLNPALASGVKIKNLHQEFVRSPSEFIALLLRSEENRKIASTDANLRSSRSHTMFRIHIESRARAAAASPDGSGAGAGADPNASNAASRKIRSSLLTFVDLAGSECISQLGGSLERQKECRYINKSLLGLSRVIVKLSENEAGDQSHVPWRDSKLTRVMKPALGGNSHTLFVCCISPTAVCKEESHNTLRFGSFANQVTNVVRVNLKEEQVRSEAARSAAEVARLRAELERRQAEQAELDRLRRANAELTERARVLHLAATQSAAEALESQKAANASAAALQDSQRMLEAEREDRERAARAAASATPTPDPRLALDALEQEKEYFKLKLRIAEGQIKLLEDKLVPMIEEARSAASDEQLSGAGKLAERDEAIAALREQLQSLERMRDADRASFEAERRRNDGDKDRVLRQLLADKIADQRALESRLAAETTALQQARLAALQGGADVLKVCRTKLKQHVVRMWLAPARDPRAGGDPLDLALHWAGKGLGAKPKFVRLADVERVKLGQATPAFERALAAPGPAATELRRPECVARSLSVVTAHRSLDVLLPSERALDMWVEGLKPLLPPRGAKVEELRPGMAAAQAAALAKEQALKEAAQRRAEEEQRLLAVPPSSPHPSAAAAASASSPPIAARPVAASASSPVAASAAPAATVAASAAAAAPGASSSSPSAGATGARIGRIDEEKEPQQATTASSSASPK